MFAESFIDMFERQDKENQTTKEVHVSLIKYKDKETNVNMLDKSPQN